MDLVNKVIAELQKDFASFLLAGVGTLIVGVLLVPLIVVAVYGGMFVGMVPGLMLQDDAIAGIGSMVGLGLGMVAMLAILVGVSAPMGASITRAVWNYLTTGEKLTIMAPFSTATQDLGRVIAFSLAHFFLILLGAMFCYFPALIVMALLIFAGPAVFIHRLPVGQAISLSVSHVQQHANWHIGFFGVAFVMQLVLSYIPILGPLLLATVLPLYVLMAYRHVFGDGPVPRGMVV